MTCDNCKFNCKSADNEACERFKNAEFYEEPPKKKTSRLDRVLKLLNDYDDLVEAALCDILDCKDAIRSLACLASLRSEKDQLTQELIEHGCRRKN